MRMLNKALLAAAAVTLVTAGSANASVIATESFALTSDHCSGSGGCIAVDGASAGTIVVSQNSDGTLTFVVTLNSGYEFVNGGFVTSFGFNLNGDPIITYSNVTTGFTPVSNPQSAGSLHMDGTGFFEYGLDCTGCGNGGSTPLPGPLSFTIDASTNLTLASLQQNADGQFFAVDIIGNGNTGAVDASVGTVPDGGTTVGLLGLGMLGLGYLRRRIG